MPFFGVLLNCILSMGFKIEGHSLFYGLAHRCGWEQLSIYCTIRLALPSSLRLNRKESNSPRVRIQALVGGDYGPCRRFESTARTPWQGLTVLLFVERFLLAILATVFVGLVVLNPLKFDWTQRITLGGCIVLGAYFVAHTALRMKETPKAVEATEPTDVALRVRISALISEAVKIQEQCQTVPNPGKKPWQAQPIFAQ